MELKDYLRVVRIYWRFLVVGLLLGVLVAGVISLLQKPVYGATSSGFVTADATTGANANTAIAPSMTDSLAKSRVASYVDLATSRATRQRVVDLLHLNKTADQLDGVATVTQPPETVLIRISVTSASPKEAQSLANAWVQALADQVKEVEGTSPGALHLRPLDTAALPKSPTSPRPKRNVLIGGLLGLLLGFGAAMIRNQLDRRLRDPEQIEKEFHVPVVASVPRSRSLARQGRAENIIPIVVGNNRTPDATEAILKLRTNLQYTDVDNPPRVVVVTSPAQGDGKSTISTNLAASLAAAGEQVVLIDADLRRPVIAAGVGLPEGAGLTDVLAHRVEIDDVLQPVTEVPGLSVLGAGSIPPNPSELLGSRSMARIIEELRASGRMVIVDAPPLLPVTDAAVLSTISDGAFIVTSDGGTMDVHLKHAVESIQAVKGRVLGVVMNRASRSGAGYYGYGYGRAYTQSNDGKSRRLKQKS